MSGGRGRLLTDAELAELSRSPGDELRDRLAAGDVEGARAAVARAEAELDHQVERYTHWLGTLVAWSAERHGPEGAAAAVDATRRFFAAYPEVGVVPATWPEPVAGRVAELAASGDRAAAQAAFEGAWAAWRDAVDLHRDWISALLSDLYRRHGPDELEAVHRRVGQATMDRLTAGIDDLPPDRRLADLVWLLKGHFAEVTVTEEDDRFVIDQHPCGTCGRQAAAGRHRPPLSLAVVDEPHLVTWWRGRTTAYRTHVPVWHVAMATERMGAPWPVNLCPADPDEGSCRIYLYKDPRDPGAAAEVPGPGPR